jgi:hypothetical protein
VPGAAAFRVAGFGRTEIEGAVGDHTHRIEKLAAEELHAHNAARRIGGDVLL